jgi:hypothetical protein
MAITYLPSPEFSDIGDVLHVYDLTSSIKAGVEVFNNPVTADSAILWTTADGTLCYPALLKYLAHLNRAWQFKSALKSTIFKGVLRNRVRPLTYNNPKLAEMDRDMDIDRYLNHPMKLSWALTDPLYLHTIMPLHTSHRFKLLDLNPSYYTLQFKEMPKLRQGLEEDYRPRIIER